MRSIKEPIFSSDLETIPSQPPQSAGELWRHVPDPNPGVVRQEALRMRHVELRQSHRDLDDGIARLSEASACDELLLARLKKRKLQIKDEIARIEALLGP